MVAAARIRARIVGVLIVGATFTCSRADDGSEFLRISTKAPSGARYSGASTGRRKANELLKQARLIFAGFPGVTKMVLNGPARRRTDRGRFSSHQYFVDLKRARTMAVTVRQNELISPWMERLRTFQA